MVGGMDAAIAQLHAEDSKDRVAAVKKLQVLLEQNQKGLSAVEVGTLLNATVDLLKDNDHEVCQGALHVLASAACLAGERLQLDFVTLLPVISDRLGDEKPSVRDAGRGLLLALMQIFTPTVVFQRVSSHISQHKNWKVREEFVRIMSSAVRLFRENDLPVLSVLLPLVMDLMEDTNPHVRDATLAFVEKMYELKGSAFKDELQRLSVRPNQLKDINARFDKTETKGCKPRENDESPDRIDSPAARDPPNPASPSLQIDVQLDDGSDTVSMTIEDKSSHDNRLSCCNNRDSEALRDVPGLITLDETLTESLAKNVDWSIRVAAFAFIKKLINEGPRGLHEVQHCFPNVINMLEIHLGDPHYKVAQAAISTLVEVVTHFKKQFTGCLETVLPLLFGPLVDARDDTSELAADALQVIGNSYDIKLLFPALLRCLDEQRTPKRQVAAIEYAIGAIVKLEYHYETISPLLKPWLTKLADLIKSRNARLKETAAMGMIAVYSHLDTIVVLEFLLALPAEEQRQVRRALKHYVPRIEVDLVYHIRYRKHRVPAISFDEEPPAHMRKPYMGLYPAVKSCEKRPPTPHELDRSGVHEGMVKKINVNCRTPQHFSSPYLAFRKLRDYNTGWDINSEKTRRWLGLYNVDPLGKLNVPHTEMVPDSQSLMQRMYNWSTDKPVAEKHDSLLAAAQLFKSTDMKSWPPFFDKLFAVELEAVKDPDHIVRDMAVVVVPDLLRQTVKRIQDKTRISSKLRGILPAIIDAFGHDNEDVRKAVLYCLVEMYCALGKTFLPYLSTLNPAQLNLVTTYASRVSQGGANVE